METFFDKLQTKLVVDLALAKLSNGNLFLLIALTYSFSYLAIFTFVQELGLSTSITRLLFLLIGDGILLCGSYLLYRQNKQRESETALFLFLLIVIALTLWHTFSIAELLVSFVGGSPFWQESFFGLKNLGALSAKATMLIGVGVMIYGYRKNSDMLQIMLDTGILLLIGSFVFFEYVWLEWSANLLTTTHPLVIAIFLLDFLTIAAVAVLWRLNYYAHEHPKTRQWQTLFLMGIIGFCLTDFLNQYGMVWSESQLRFDIIWQGCLFLAIFSQYRRASVLKETVTCVGDSEIGSLSMRIEKIRYLHIGALFVIIALQLDPTYMTLIGLLLIIHYMVTKYVHIYHERYELIEQYAHMNTHLEQVVIERTKELVKKNATLETLATHDPLTNLPNSRYVQSCTTTLITAGTPFVFAYLDLDRFKAVNDWYGHDVGDSLLLAVSKRVQELLSPTALFARQGGDEFIIICPEIAQLEHQLTQLLIAFEQPFELAEHTVTCTFSIGTAQFPDQATTYQELAKCADLALYHSKAVGRNQWTRYESHYKRQLTLEYDLKTVNFADEFALHYQPEFNIQTNQLVGCEALVRWHHLSLGFIPPTEFIQLAEEIGQINRLGDWVLESACAQIALWNQTQEAPLFIAVNVSPKQLRQPNFVTRVQALFAQYQIDPNWIELELIETQRIDEEPVVLAQLQQLSDLGIRIAIDDFGTGYSSISYLKLFPVHKLKIARELVYQMTSESLDTKIVAGLVKLADSINVTTIAEGVETYEQLVLLKQLGCEQVQGYYYSRPIPSAEFTTKYL